MLGGLHATDFLEIAPPPPPDPKVGPEDFVLHTRTDFFASACPAAAIGIHLVSTTEFSVFAGSSRFRLSGSNHLRRPHRQAHRQAHHHGRFASRFSLTETMQSPFVCRSEILVSFGRNTPSASPMARPRVNASPTHRRQNPLSSPSRSRIYARNREYEPMPTAHRTPPSAVPVVPSIRRQFIGGWRAIPATKPTSGSIF
jgi:hypothetical protein